MRVTQCNNTFFVFFISQQSNDDWIADGSFLDSIFSMETDDLLGTSDFAPQPDLIDNMLNFCDPPMFDGDQHFKNEPMFSSGASDSGLSSDNLDLYVLSHCVIAI